MAFPQEQPIVPTAIGDISVTLTDIADPAAQSAQFEVQVLDGNGCLMRLLRGDLVPHITAQQRQGLIDFMNDLRAQAESEILGE